MLDLNGSPERLMNRNFFLLWQGQLVSQVGTQVFVVGMMYWAMEATGSASLMGVLMMLSILPGVVLGPLGGTVADRYSRRTTIIVSDLLSGLGVLMVTGVFFFRPAATRWLIAGLFLVSVLNGVIQAFFRPAILAAIPDLVPQNRISAANSMNQFTYQFSMVLGQGSGGVLYGVFGAPLLFLIDGLTFLFSAVSECFIRIPQRTPEKVVGLGNTLASFWKDLSGGLRHVWEWRGMRDFLIMVGLINFFAMPFMVLMPFFVEIRLMEGADWYGYLMAAFSAGSIAGYAFAAAFPVKGKVRHRLLIGALAVGGLCFGGLGLLGEPLPAALILFVAGTLLGVFNINAMTIFQTTTSSEMRGRVMGVMMTIVMAASPLGMVAGGIAGDLTGKNVPLIYAVCGLAIAGVVATIGTRRSVIEYLAYEP